MKKEDAVGLTFQAELIDATRIVPSRNVKRRNKQGRKNVAIALFDLAGDINALAQDFLREDKKVTRKTVQIAKDKTIDSLIILRRADEFTDDDRGG